MKSLSRSQNKYKSNFLLSACQQLELICLSILQIYHRNHFNNLFMSGTPRVNFGTESREFRNTSPNHANSIGSGHFGGQVSPGHVTTSYNQPGSYYKTSDGRMIPVEEGVTYQSNYRPVSGELNNNYVSTSNYAPAGRYENRTVRVEGQPLRQNQIHHQTRTEAPVYTSNYGSTGGAYPGGYREQHAVSYQPHQNTVYREQEIQRPTYEKSYSNTYAAGPHASYKSEERVGAGYNRNERQVRVSGQAGVETKKKKNPCCHPAVLALLGCLALAGLILGILFGTGVLGGGGGGDSSEAVAAPVLIDGVQYPKETITVQTTTVRNDVQDGNQDGSSSSAAVAGGGAAGAAGAAGYTYFTNSNGQKSVSIDGANYVVYSDDGLQFIKKNGQTYLLKDGGTFLVETDEQGKSYVTREGKNLYIGRIQLHEESTINTNSEGVAPTSVKPIVVQPVAA